MSFEAAESIKVVVRIRPLQKHELLGGRGDREKDRDRDRENVNTSNNGGNGGSSNNNNNNGGNNNNNNNNNNAIGLLGEQAGGVRCGSSLNEVILKSEKSSDLVDKYSCHRCFPKDVDQTNFFSESGVTALLDSALKGYRACAFAFGQTGAGKVMLQMLRISYTFLVFIILISFFLI